MEIKHCKTLLFLYWLRKIVALMIFFSTVCAANANVDVEKDFQDVVSVGYIAGWENKDKSFQSAIEIALAPGWKTYWKNPGPFGIRPIINWSKSSNIKNIEISWPAPKIFHQLNVRIIGYDNIVIIPIKIIKQFPQKEAFLHIDLEFGVCSDICLMKKAEIISPLKIQPSAESLNQITQALKKIPERFSNSETEFYKCAIKKNSTGLRLVYSIYLSEIPNFKPTLIIRYAFSDLYPENQTIKIKGQQLLINASLDKISEEEGFIERDRLETLLITNKKSFEIFGCD